MGSEVNDRPKSQTSIKGFMSNVIKPKEKCVEDLVEVDERPKSQASIKGFMSNEIKERPLTQASIQTSQDQEFNTHKPENSTDVKTEEAQVKDESKDKTSRPTHLQSFRNKCSSGKDSLSHWVKDKEEKWPHSFQKIQKKRLAVNEYISELKKEKNQGRFRRREG